MSMPPHGGGDLVDLPVSAQEREALRAHAGRLVKVALDAREQTDLELLAIGGFTPLTGFMTEQECKSVVNEMHLPGGAPWTVPVTCAVDEDTAKRIAIGDE